MSKNSSSEPSTLYENSLHVLRFQNGFGPRHLEDVKRLITAHGYTLAELAEAQRQLDKSETPSTQLAGFAWHLARNRATGGRAS